MVNSSQKNDSRNSGKTSIDKVASMGPVKDRLGTLSEHISKRVNVIYDFGEYLAGVLNEKLSPQGFVMAAEIALTNLERGIDGFSGEPINNRLVGYPKRIYEILRGEIPSIAEAVCSKHFARGVVESYRQLNHFLKEIE